MVEEIEDIKMKFKHLWSIVSFLPSILLPPAELICKAQIGKMYKLLIIFFFKNLEMNKNYSDAVEIDSHFYVRLYIWEKSS